MTATEARMKVLSVLYDQAQKDGGSLNHDQLLERTGLSYEQASFIARYLQEDPPFVRTKDGYKIARCGILHYEDYLDDQRRRKEDQDEYDRRVTRENRIENRDQHFQRSQLRIAIAGLAVVFFSSVLGGYIGTVLGRDSTNEASKKVTSQSTKQESENSQYAVAPDATETKPK